MKTVQLTSMLIAIAMLLALLPGCEPAQPTVVKPLSQRQDPTGKINKTGGATINTTVYPAPPGVYTGLKGGKKD